MNSDIAKRRVLVIDDDLDTLALIRSLCLEIGAMVDEADTGERGLERARQSPPDLVLLDMVLPDASGTDIAHELRAEPRLAGVPIVMVSARRDQATKVAAFESGASDYVLKPFDLREIVARVLAQLRNRELYEKLERANTELRLANARLEELATTDELTGLMNARSLRERLDAEFVRAERYETPLSLVIADLDGFKAINDSYGHAAGDRLLAQLAQRLGAQARATDLVSRYGGDEFAFLLPHTGIAEARSFAERLVERTGASPLRLPNGSLAPVGLSCGVAGWPESAGVSVAKELFLVADQALYRAKDGGRGTVVVSPLDPEPPFDVEKSRSKRWPGPPRSPKGAEAV